MAGCFRVTPDGWAAPRYPVRAPVGGPLPGTPSERRTLPGCADGAVEGEDRGENVRAAVLADEADRGGRAGGQRAVVRLVDDSDLGAVLGPHGVPPAAQALPRSGPVEGQRPAVERCAVVGDL